jgi:DNA end-binding protein Ku
MRDSGMGAIGRFVRSGRETLCLVRPKEDALALETLFLAEDVFSQAEIDEVVEETEVKEPELALAHQIIDGLAGSFDPSTLSSDYRHDLRKLLEAKLRGEEIAEPEPLPEKAPVIDLMEALKASVAAAKEPKTAKKKAPAKRRRPAKSS